MVEKSAKALKVVYCYAHEDKELRDELERHLAALRRLGHIVGWYDRNIKAGTEWAQEIDARLNAADIILLLISSSFIDSDYCFSRELRLALERHKQGEAHVIPIILRPVDWEGTLISELQVLPTEGRAVTGSSWQNRDEAFWDVSRGIRKVVESLLAQKVDPQYIYAQATNGSPVLFDLLDCQNMNNWSEGNRGTHSFAFLKGAYHIQLENHNHFVVGYANALEFGDFVFQVEMMLLAGDGGGLIFRAGKSQPYGYRFGLTRDYFDLVYGAMRLHISYEIKVDLYQTYLLTVIARGSSLLLYVHRHCVANIEDDSASSGKIGLMAADFVHHAHVVFRNLRVWSLTGK